MGNKHKKAKVKLDQRIAAYEAIPVERRKGFKRPGSMNGKKQYSNQVGKKLGRR